MAKTSKPERTQGRPTESGAPHHAIQSLEVTGGFLRGAKLEFARGLNCIIGGRGAGKTTVLELVRYVLGLLPEEKGGSMRARAKAIVQTNLGSGRVRLRVRTKHGVGYLAERAWNEQAQVFNEQGDPTNLSFDRSVIFTADVYSQSEIEEIAANPSFQLTLLDRFIEEDVRRLESEIRRLQGELSRNAGDLLRLTREIRELEDVTSQAPEIDAKLEALQKEAGPDAKLVSAAHERKTLREKERTALDALHGDLEKVRTDLEIATTSLVRRLETRIDAEMVSGTNKAVFGVVSERVGELVALLEKSITKIAQEVEEADGLVTEKKEALVGIHAKQEAEYRELLARSKEESGRAAERTQTQKRHAEISNAKKELELRLREKKERVADREELAEALSARRDERFALRKKIASELSKELEPEIRVRIKQSGNPTLYRELLSEALKAQSIRHPQLLDRIVAGVSPPELVRIVMANDVRRFVEIAGLKDEDKGRRVLEALQESDSLHEIETVELEDLPQIELQDGTSYKPSADLSTGQRCTTILPILLRESERPLLIDQPEDNLDNAFIFRTVVKSLKGIKGRRQIIVVTHNPNIPVLGDAERVFVLESDGNLSKISKTGSVDELRREIELHLEGGPEAFRERKERYGY